MTGTGATHAGVANTHTALVIPANVKRPVVIYDLPDDDSDELARLVGGGERIGDVDFLLFRSALMSVAMQDWVKGLPVNTRAVNYLRHVIGEHEYVIRGDVVFIGHDKYGEYADVPQAAIRAINDEGE